jgi:hypothetical protein
MEAVCDSGSCPTAESYGTFNKREITTLTDATMHHTWYKLRVSKQLEERMTERVGHSLAFSPESKTVYMIGGGNRTGDMKQFWMFPADSNPFHGSVHDKLSMEFPGLYEFACISNSGNTNTEVNETIWIFGGANSLENKNDVYELDLKDLSVTKCFDGKKFGSASDIPMPRTQGNNSCLISSYLFFQQFLCMFIIF